MRFSHFEFFEHSDVLCIRLLLTPSYTMGIAEQKEQ